MADYNRLLPTLKSQWRLDSDVSNVEFKTSLDSDLPKVVDLVIIGLGGAGLSAARRAAELGMSVVGLDAGPLGRGAAGSNGGFLLCGASKFYNDSVKSYGRNTAERMWQLTKEELLQQIDEWPDVVKQTGTYRCAGWPYIESHQQPRSYDEDVNDVMEHFLALRESGISVELGDIDGTASILINDDGWCQPVDRLLKAYEAAQAAGARLYFNYVAELDSTSDTPSVITAAGKLKARNVIVATDAHLEEFFPELSGEVVTWKLQMVSLECDTDRFTIPTYMRYGYDYVAKTTDGIALGGLRDYYVDSEIATKWRGAAPLNHAITEQLVSLGSLITGRPVRLKTSWSSAAGYTTSGLPIAREVRPKTWVCGAYSGHGNLLSYVCGKTVVDRITLKK